MPVHPIPPVFDGNSRVLILGSFPSVRSRETGFFYGHPQNRFWRVIAAVTGDPTPETVEEKKELLLHRGIALWDVAASCDITGSSDASLKNAVPNDLSPIFRAADIRAVFTNGSAADRLYDRFFGDVPGPPKFRMPSTSPANAAFGFGRLVAEWSALGDYLK